MKVAVSIEGGRDLQAAVCPTFGRAPRFLVTDLETGETTVVENTAASGAHGAGSGAAGLLVRLGVNAVLSGRFGPKAFDALEAARIEMFVSTSDVNAATAIERFRAGLLKKASRP